MLNNFLKTKLHFEVLDPVFLRGSSTSYAITNYASHILEKIMPKPNAKMLDVGCGDGLIMNELMKLRPDLTIDGVELSDGLASMARVKNPNSNIHTGNILELGLQLESYDVIFSFSCLQYFSFQQIIGLQSHLRNFLKEGGFIFHLSIPDIRLRLAYTAKYQILRYGWLGFIRLPIAHIYHKIRYRNKFDSWGYWHDPRKLKVKLASLGWQVLFSDSDSFYRFDLRISPQKIG